MSVALFIHHAKRMHLTILSSLASLALPYFSISQKHQDFRWRGEGGVEFIEHKICVLFSLKFPSETSVILRIIQQHIVTNVHTSSRKAPVILIRFYLKLNFLETF